MKPAQLRKDAPPWRRFACLSAITIYMLLPQALRGESPKLAWNGQLASDVSEREVSQLIQQLGDLSFEVRERATARLTDIGPAVLPAVVEATRSHDPEVCLRSWRIIDQWAAQGDVLALLTQLQSRSPSIRSSAADTLAKLEPRPLSAVPGLLDAADDPIEFVRVSAREALKKIQETRGLRLEFQETAERLEVGGQTTIRLDITNCGKEPIENIRLLARVPAQLDVTAAQGGNRPLQHETLPGKLVSESFLLEPNATLRWEISVKALAAGDARFKVELSADGLPHPLVEEKTTPVHVPMPKPDQP
jgi:hypothetical protein